MPKVWVQKNNIWHWDQNSFFSFDESLLDAESSLEDVLDTNITSFLRRFWIRYQNGTTSHYQKGDILGFAGCSFFQKLPPEAYLHHETYVFWKILPIRINTNKTKYQKYESRKAIYDIGTKILLLLWLVTARRRKRFRRCPWYQSNQFFT